MLRPAAVRMAASLIYGRDLLCHGKEAMEVDVQNLFLLLVSC